MITALDRSVLQHLHPYQLPYSAKFSSHTIFADRVVGSISWKKFSLTKEILLARLYEAHNLTAPNFRGSRPLREKRENYAPQKI